MRGSAAGKHHTPVTNIYGVIAFPNFCNNKSRKENPQKLTQLSSRSHPRHLVGKRTAQKDTIIDITSDSQVNSNFPNRWSPASLTVCPKHIPKRINGNQMQLDTLKEGNEKNIEKNPFTRNYAVISLPDFPRNRLFWRLSQILFGRI